MVAAIVAVTVAQLECPLPPGDRGWGAASQPGISEEIISKQSQVDLYCTVLVRRLLLLTCDAGETRHVTIAGNTTRRTS